MSAQSERFTEAMMEKILASARLNEDGLVEVEISQDMVEEVLRENPSLVPATEAPSGAPPKENNQ